MTKEIIFIGVIAALLALSTAVNASREIGCCDNYAYAHARFELVPTFDESYLKTKYRPPSHYAGLFELRSLWRYRRGEYLARLEPVYNSLPGQRSGAMGE